ALCTYESPTLNITQFSEVTVAKHKIRGKWYHSHVAIPPSLPKPFFLSSLAFLFFFAFKCFPCLFASSSNSFFFFLYIIIAAFASSTCPTPISTHSTIHKAETLTLS